jgi:hypothetical protein
MFQKTHNPDGYYQFLANLIQMGRTTVIALADLNMFCYPDKMFYCYLSDGNYFHHKMVCFGTTREKLIDFAMKNMKYYDGTKFCQFPERCKQNLMDDNYCSVFVDDHLQDKKIHIEECVFF